ncbi:MAG: hypothetical protein P794_07925 [Epsilonproteobacteria bacterium (ex Lamellibrachia satsuma)]|nr:MAG: hypothetical protein P794_07925 [Epsilonproteobacteria bacterium (ex Lamellibrachia satsuma)]
MAPQSKRTSNRSSRRKMKPTAKKTVVKKRTRKKSQKKSHFKKNIFIVLGVFLMISLVAFGYFLGQNDKKHNPKQVKKTKTVYVAKKKKDADTNPIKEPIKDHPSQIKAKKERADRDTSVSASESMLAYRSKKPKLVIIIDDVHTEGQINAIKALDMKISPSIFPPYKLAPKSYLLARGLKHYLIHLPMESSSQKFNRQYKTLKTYFTKEQIEARVKEIRALFPTARYINNHTGSTFTANYKAMHMLYGILRKEGFIFIDSRTTNLTKVRKIAHEFGDAYVARDIFIDNIHTVPSIHKQLRQAVKIAKKKGYAIAIGHPHKVTMQALASAKQILKDVELVYIDDIYKRK